MILTLMFRVSGEENIAEVLSQKSEPGQGNHTVWMVSNCDATRGAVVRQQYVSRLVDNGLKLDGFGECFNNVLVDSPWTTQNHAGYHWGLFAKYKFYLAFENSIHCNGYISEKMWRNSLAQGLVPVIYGPHPDDVKVLFYPLEERVPFSNFPVSKPNNLRLKHHQIRTFTLKISTRQKR